MDCVPHKTAAGVARGYLGDPNGFVKLLGAEAFDGGDSRFRSGLILMDVVGGEEVLAIACIQELVDPRAHWVGSHRSDVEDVLAGFGEEKLDGLCCFLRAHLRGEAHVGVVALVEGEHPRRRVRTVDQVDRFRNIAKQRASWEHDLVLCDPSICRYRATSARR